METNYGFQLLFFLIFIWVHWSLSCGTWNLHCIMQDLFVAVPDSLVVVCGLCAGLAAPWHVDNSSLTRDQTHVPCIARQILNHWTTREVPMVFSF